MSDSSYDVGYGKPPKHSRFRKGASGNRKGRPKGKRNFVSVLAETLEEKIVIDDNGVPKTVTKLEAALKQLVNKAASGDLIALRQLTALARSAEERALEPTAKQLSDVDLEIMQRVLQRERRCLKGVMNDDQ
jgi:hypothetical protein